MMRNTAWALAPLPLIGFFAAYGDNWDLHSLRLLILVGTAVFGPTSSLLLWFFADVQAVSIRIRPAAYIHFTALRRIATALVV